jgi:hypothetical protein
MFMSASRGTPARVRTQWQITLACTDRDAARQFLALHTIGCPDLGRFEDAPASSASASRWIPP